MEDDIAKLYAILHEAGICAAKWEAGEWSAGVYICRDAYGRITVTYETPHSDRDGTAALHALHHSVVPTLSAAGVAGGWMSADAYWVEG